MSFMYKGRNVPSVVKINPKDICALIIAQNGADVRMFNHGGSGIY
jgi:hypothetical protein